MQIEILKSKIHKVKVTHSNLNYIGSITIDETLINAAKMVVGEKVQVLNINNGERLDTYIIKGEKNSGEVSLNGPAARKVQIGDQIIIISYGRMSISDAKNFNPTLIFPNKNNFLN
ncbi:MAG: aspartate 1-decarboxylase [Flavobacteriaceae bacterium]|nr:aspartate 1-decarboxylase [Flavobacteriaceae bacterium]|tara:strand:- start:3922 stop:4269 length:348 start_codon:yes stop_codon:yes gene_type:complete